MGLAAYIFDLDYTLVENKAFRYACELLPRRIGLGVSPEVFCEVFLDTYYQLVRKGELYRAFDWCYVAKLTAEKFGGRMRERMFLELFLDGVDMGLVKVCDGAISLLRRIKSLGYIVVILTNGYGKYQIPVIRKIRLDKYIDAIFTAEKLPKPKPHSDSFDVVMEYSKRKLGAEKIFFIGDHPFFDIYGALNAGIKNIFWVDKNIKEGIYSVEEISGLIEGYTLRRYGVHITIDTSRGQKVVVVNSLKSIQEKFWELFL